MTYENPNSGNTLVDHIDAHRRQVMQGERERSEAPKPEKPISETASDAVNYCARAADLLRSQAATIKSLAVTIEAEAEALALDIEHRAQRFKLLVAQFSELTKQTTGVFESERKRLDGFEIPPAVGITK
jgi:hypothetical protein